MFDGFLRNPFEVSGMTSVIAPAIAFVIAAGIGIAIRKRSAREDRRYRELNFSS